MNVDILQPVARNYAINVDAMRAQAAGISATVANYDKYKKPKTVALNVLGKVLKIFGACFRSLDFTVLVLKRIRA